MRTEAEIVALIRTLDESKFDDLDGRRRSRLTELLPYSLAKPWLKPEATESEWHQVTVEELRERCHNDLVFAWQKALDHRGISAGLMAEVMVDWVWLLCSEAEYQQVKDAPYPNYGAPQLTLAGRLLDMSANLNATEQAMAERMAQGKSCRPGCSEGCGR